MYVTISTMIKKSKAVKIVSSLFMLLIIFLGFFHLNTIDTHHKTENICINSSTLADNSTDYSLELSWRYNEHGKGFLYPLAMGSCRLPGTP